MDRKPAAVNGGWIFRAPLTTLFVLALTRCGRSTASLHLDVTTQPDQTPLPAETHQPYINDAHPQTMANQVLVIPPG